MRILLAESINLRRITSTGCCEEVPLRGLMVFQLRYIIIKEYW